MHIRQDNTLLPSLNQKSSATVACISIQLPLWRLWRVIKVQLIDSEVNSANGNWIHHVLNIGHFGKTTLQWASHMYRFIAQFTIGRFKYLNKRSSHVPMIRNTFAIRKGHHCSRILISVLLFILNHDLRNFRQLNDLLGGFIWIWVDWSVSGFGWVCLVLPSLSSGPGSEKTVCQNLSTHFRIKKKANVLCNVIYCMILMINSHHQLFFFNIMTK